MCGVSEERFWHMNPKKLHPYQVAYRKKVEYESWRSGYYVLNAIASSISSKAKYPKKPLDEADVSVGSRTSDADKFAIWAVHYNKTHNLT